ncbi:unnamed protein product [Auanema sp. JU1783]|nr:unnamed protein product [Auanema sp. JU1783]
MRPIQVNLIICVKDFCIHFSPCLPVLQLPQQQPSCSPPCSPPQRVQLVALEAPCSPCNPSNSESYSPRLLAQPCSPCDNGYNRDVAFLAPAYSATNRDASLPRFVQGPIYQISPQIVPVPFYVSMLPPTRNTPIRHNSIVHLPRGAGKSSLSPSTADSQYPVDPQTSLPPDSEYASARPSPPPPSPYDYYPTKTGESVATFENTRYAPQHKTSYSKDTEPYKLSGSATVADNVHFRNSFKAYLKKSSYEVGESSNKLPPPPPPPSPDQSLSESYANFGNGSYNKRESKATFIDTDENQPFYPKKYPNTYAKFEYAK